MILAAYLFLQWAGGARIYTWLTANPAGYRSGSGTDKEEYPPRSESTYA